MKIKINYFLLIIFIVATSCGFKVVDQSKLINFSINEIISNGDKRINYKIKNKVLFKAKTRENKNKIINLNLTTKKVKDIKEKNIKNEITKYQIRIETKVNIDGLNIEAPAEFSISKSGDFKVGIQHSQTLNNEKALVELLSETPADEIVSEIIFKLNDI